MKVVRKHSGELAAVLVDAALDVREEELRDAMVLEIDRYGGDGPACDLAAGSTEELMSLMADVCWSLGRDDVLRKLADPELDDADRIDRMRLMIDEHFGEFDPQATSVSEVAEEKEIVGYRVRESDCPDEPVIYAIVTDMCHNGFWWGSKEEVPPIPREDALALLEKVRADGDQAKLVCVTRKKKKP